MKVELAPGDKLVITLEGTGGEFTILFDHENDNRVRVFADMPDDKERGGDLSFNDMRISEDVPLVDPEIYCVSFGHHDERDAEGNLLTEDLP